MGGDDAVPHTPRVTGRKYWQEWPAKLVDKFKYGRIDSAFINPQGYLLIDQKAEHCKYERAYKKIGVWCVFWKTEKIGEQHYYQRKVKPPKKWAKQIVHKHLESIRETAIVPPSSIHNDGLHQPINTSRHKKLRGQPTVPAVGVQQCLQDGA